MEAALGNSKARLERATWLRCIGTPERVAFAYFAWIASAGLLRPLTVAQRTSLLALPCALVWLWVLEARHSRPWSRVVRQWASLALILAGYWAVGWFAGPHRDAWQARWVEWDRLILDDFGLRRAIESTGRVIPISLETCYTLLYAIPPASLGAIYLCGARRRADRFLTVLFLGTFLAYALLPFFPVASPRKAFPDRDLPSVHSSVRGLNTWLLDNADISTSVFPSGHVAVAFSSALGLLAVLRSRKAVWMAGFAAAAIVWVATIYGRYHYAVDGLASLLLASIGWLLTEKSSTE